LKEIQISITVSKEMSKRNLVNFGPLMKVIGIDVDSPQVDNVHSAYAKAFEFEPHDFATREISTCKIFAPANNTRSAYAKAPGERTLGFAPNF